MIGQKHIINREVLDITVTDRGRAATVQNKTAELVSNKLNPALDKLFSGMSGSDEIIRIDKLEIDIGTISESELENSFTGKVISEISDKIALLIQSSSSGIYDKPTDVESVNSKGHGVSVTNKSTDVLTQFVYFLESGFLPWWSKSIYNENVSSKNSIKNLFKEVLNTDKALFGNTVAPLLKKEKVRKRLLYQCNHSCLYELLKRLNTDLFKSYSDQFQVLISCVGSVEISKLLNQSFYETALFYIGMEIKLNSKKRKITFLKEILYSALSENTREEKEKILFEMLLNAQSKIQDTQQKDLPLLMVAIIQIATESSSKSQLFQQMVQNLAQKNDAVINTLIEQAVKKAKKEAAGRNSVQKNKYEKSIEGFSVENEGEPDEKDTIAGEKKGEGKGTGTGAGKHADKTKSLESSIFSSKPDIGNEQILIFNSGLVLLHPFLRYFFEGLNLLNNDLQFKSEIEVFKAVHLLQFIATGQESTQETELTLNKILCGLDVTEPVPLNVPLSEEEKQECLFLIKTVLERWEALKTNNPAALRETYLQREGILKQAGQSWNIIIKRNTFDIMLERLPWSISLIKLPWCGQILYVEW